MIKVVFHLHLDWEALPWGLTHQIPGWHRPVRNAMEWIPGPLAAEGGPCVFQVPSRGPRDSLKSLWVILCCAWKCLLLRVF